MGSASCLSWLDSYRLWSVTFSAANSTTNAPTYSTTNAAPGTTTYTTTADTAHAANSVRDLLLLSLSVSTPDTTAPAHRATAGSTTAGHTAFPVAMRATTGAHGSNQERDIKHTGTGLCARCHWLYLLVCLNRETKGMVCRG